MGIKEIKLGPKSPLLERAGVTAGGKVTTERIGCGCGQQLLPSRDFMRTIDGVVHRHGKPCHAEGGSKQQSVAPRPERANREGDQPLPTEGHGDVIATLQFRLEERKALGVRRYARALQLFNGRDPFKDHEDELLDQHVYAEQIRGEYLALEAAVLALAAVARGEQVADDMLSSSLALAVALEARRAR